MKSSSRLASVDFSIGENKEITKNEELYQGDDVNLRYRNFLDWLFETFRTSEESFRLHLIGELGLQQGSRILITGCGNGDDIEAFCKYSHLKNLDLKIHAQDLSRSMVEFSLKRFSSNNCLSLIEVNISSATNLPYQDNIFDTVFHFGGLNYMSDPKKAIHEMTRVVKNSGRVAFIDESIAPWLRDSEYGRMMIENNSLWSAKLPLDYLPFNANNVLMKFVLENCFYFILFDKDISFPDVDFDVEHLGPRGGSIRTRYFGKLEGVTESAKKSAIRKASENSTSLSTWLTSLIEKS